MVEPLSELLGRAANMTQSAVSGAVAAQPGPQHKLPLFFVISVVLAVLHYYRCLRYRPLQWYG